MLSRRRLVVLVLMLVASLVVIPMVFAQEMTPSVTVSDQEIVDGTVTIDSAVSDGPGWVVIHIQEDGAPGAVIGHAALEDGENMDVTVEIDVSQATETLYAMLHTDTGQMGTYEFPDGDPPVTVEGDVVLQPFTITGGLRPSVSVMDQAIEDGMVTVPEVVSDGQGWMVIHADDDGSPGPVIGQAQVSDGVNRDVSVEIDVEMATETLYAMLHADTGEMGAYEFPDADPPVQVEGNVVVKPFAITGGLPGEEEATATPTPTGEEAMLPETGAGAGSVLIIGLVLGGIVAMALGLLIRTMRSSKARARVEDSERS